MVSVKTRKRSLFVCLFMIAHYEEVHKNTPYFIWYIAVCVAVLGEQKVPGIGKWLWYFETTTGGIYSSEKWCNVFAGGSIKDHSHPLKLHCRGF